MTTKKKLSLGDFLKNYRLGEELTQKEMGEILGISKTRLSDIENGRYCVGLKTCKEIASKLDLPVEWLAKLPYKI